MVFFFCCPPFFFFFCRLCLEFPSFYSLEWLVQFVPTLTMKSFISVKTVVTRGAQSPMMSLQRKDFGAVLIKVKLKPVSTWSALELEVSEFLLYLQPPKNISSALPIDIVKFLVWKDVNGRTVVHKPHCKFLGVKGKTQCDCPTRLARGTVDSVIGKLRSIFSSHDRVGDWNAALGFGNPAASKDVKDYFSSNISKTSASVSSGFPNTRKHHRTRSGLRPRAFIVFECLETPMKHDARVF